MYVKGFLGGRKVGGRLHPRDEALGGLRQANKKGGGTTRRRFRP